MFIALNLFVLRTTASQSINNSEFVVLSGIALAVIGMKHAMSVKSCLKLVWVLQNYTLVITMDQKKHANCLSPGRRIPVNITGQSMLINLDQSYSKSIMYRG